MSDVIGEILADIYQRGKTNQYRLDEHFISDIEEMSYQSDLLLQSKIAIENYYRAEGVSVEQKEEK